MVLSLVLITGFTACKSKKAVSTSKMGETLIEVYCSGPEYFSNSKFFRANQVGESLDQATAKKKARSNAMAEMASSIQTLIKGVIDNYVNSREMNNKEVAEERFESLTREVIDQQLSGVKTICEQTTKTTEGNYKVYIAIELSGQDLVKAINSRLSQEEMLRIDYDYEQFKKTFDAEMEKLEKRRGN